jgi:hypothetical protein
MTAEVTVFSGNLFEIAALYLGDATQWVRIAQLNNLRDPEIQGMTTLTLPLINSNAGGGIVVQ